MAAKIVDYGPTDDGAKCLTCSKPATKRVLNTKNEDMGVFCDHCADYLKGRLDERERKREAAREARR